MKIVLLVFVVAVLLFMLRGGRGSRRRADPKRPAPEGEPQAMLRCAQCGLHLPRDEALPGRGGVFCGSAHRAAYEQAHPEGR